MKLQIVFQEINPDFRRKNVFSTESRNDWLQSYEFPIVKDFKLLKKEIIF